MNNKDWYCLVVEDDPDGQDLVQRILRRRNIKMDTVFDAEDALDLLAERSYTAAIIDLALPGMDGWSLLNAIRSDPKTMNLPCFAITAFHSAEVAMMAIENGFTAYFPKPLDPATLVTEMERVMMTYVPNQ